LRGNPRMTAALLVLDATVSTTRPTGSFGKLMDPSTDFAGVVGQMHAAVEAARTANMLVAWVVPGSAFIQRMTGRVALPEEARPDESIGVPASDEPVIEKEAIGAFTGSELEAVLRDA